MHTAYAFHPADYAATFEETLIEEGLHAALRFLNRDVDYRFTGVYCFEPDWVRSFRLFDRENPTLVVGADVRMRESYCMYTGQSNAPVVIEDAQNERRWVGHAARDQVLSYVAVLLHDANGIPLGTLCHFDFCARHLDQAVLERLFAVREAVQEYLLAEGVVAHPGAVHPAA